MKNLIIVFAVFLIAALGCKMTGTNSTNSENVSKNSNSNIGSNNSNSKEQTSKVSDPANVSDSKEELLNAFKKFRNVPFVTVKSVSNDNKSETIIEQYSSVNSSFSRKSENGEATETIIVGSETFSRMNSSWEWKKESDAKTTASDSFFFPYSNLEKHIPDFDIKSKGEETINGKTATVYELTLSKPNPEVPSLIKIWIGKDNGLPLKIFNEIEQDTNLTRTFDFDSKVDIKRPTVGKK